MRKIYSFIMAMTMMILGFATAQAQYTEDGCTAHFIVNDGEEPIAGAIVGFLDEEYTTDENGKVDVKLAGEEWIGQTLPFTVSDINYEWYEGEITFDSLDGYGIASLTPATFTATFKVRNPELEPVEGAWVTFLGQEKETNANGQAVFTGTMWNGKNLSYTVDYEYYHADGVLELEGVENYPVVDLSLPLCTANFKVMDTEGEPVANAMVTIGEESVMTDENGSAILKGDWIGQTVSYTVSNLNYDFYEGEITFEGMDGWAMAYLTPATFTATFKVLDPEEEPVEGAYVYFMGEEKVTDANGQTVFTGTMWDGKNLSYSVSYEYYFTEGVLNLDAIENYPVVYLSLPECTANFKVMDTEGEPVADAFIWIGDAEAITDENGNASLTGDWMGKSINYTVYKDGFEGVDGSMDFTEGMENTAVVYLEPVLCTVTFKVFGTDEEPAEGAWVYFNGEEKETNENGEAVFTGYLFGQELSYEVDKDYESAYGTVVWESYDPIIVVNLEAPVCTATVIVRDADGEPVDGARVIIEGTDYQTGANGTVVVEGNWIGQEIPVFASFGDDTVEGTLNFTEGMDGYAVLILMNTSGVDSIEAAGNEGVVIYNLQGQRVKKATKGVFIINGKKVIVK